jgi:hypothetical protein
LEKEQKSLSLGLNPSIDFCSGSYLVDSMSDLCTSVASSRQVMKHIDFAGSTLASD